VRHCREILDHLPLHCGGDLPLDLARKVEAHVAGCSRCAAELEAWRRLRGVLLDSREPEQADASGLWQRLEPRLDVVDAAAGLRPPWWRRPVVWGAGLAAALLLGLGPALWRATGVGSRASAPLRPPAPAEVVVAPGPAPALPGGLSAVSRQEFDDLLGRLAASDPLRAGAPVPQPGSPRPLPLRVTPVNGPADW